MKRLALISAVLAFSTFSSLSAAEQSAKGRPDVYTTRVIKVKSDYDASKKTFERLNAVLHKTKGFEKRNLFYDKDQNLWIDQIKWKHADAAKQGLLAIRRDSSYAELEKIIDGKPLAEYQYEHILEVDAAE